MQLSADGGEATLLFAPETGQRARWPHLLSGGDVLFTLGDAGPDTGDLHVLIRDTGEHQLLVSTAAAGRVLDTGHLVFVRSGALWAVPFDLDRLDIVGSPVPVVEGVRVEAGGSIQYAIADNGVLVYIPGGFDTGQVQVAWVDRGGGEQRLPLPARNYWSLSLSPDGTRAAFGIRDQDNEDVWVGDLERGSLTRITSHAGVDRSARRRGSHRSPVVEGSGLPMAGRSPSRLTATARGKCSADQPTALENRMSWPRSTASEDHSRSPGHPTGADSWSW